MSDFNSLEFLDWLWRILLAQGMIFLLFIAGMISFALPMTDQVRPYFIIMAIYYWAVYRPTLMHPLEVFAFGVVYDLVLGFPIGGHAILFLLVQWVIRNQRLFLLGQTYLVVWIGFILTCVSVYLSEWLFYSAFEQTWLSATPMMMSVLVTILVFPLASLLFIGVHRFLPVAPNAHL